MVARKIFEPFIRIGIVGPHRELGERLTAKSFASGASGLEERDAAGLRFWAYAPGSVSDSLGEVLATFCIEGASVDSPEPVPTVDWKTLTRASFRPVRGGGCLQVQPSWAPIVPEANRNVVLVDPGQAFGTGSHISTRIALGLLVQLEGQLKGVTILDVGCGSGILALTALRLGTGRAVAFDLDPLAAEATRMNAERRELQGPARLFLWDNRGAEWYGALVSCDESTS